MKPFKIVSLSDLICRGHNGQGMSAPQVSAPVNFWRRIFGNGANELQLRAEANRLRADLLAAVRACEDAGRIGLDLYAENELLREQVAVGSSERLVRQSELYRLEKDNLALRQKLDALSVAHDRLVVAHEDWLRKFSSESSGS